MGSDAHERLQELMDRDFGEAPRCTISYRPMCGSTLKMHIIREKNVIKVEGKEIFQQRNCSMFRFQVVDDKRIITVCWSTHTSSTSGSHTKVI